MDFIEETVLNILEENRSQKDFQELSEEERRSLGETHYRFGKIYYDKSDLKLAQFHFEHSLKLCFEVKDFYFEFKVLGFLIRMASESLNHEACELYIQRSESITERAINELGTLSAEVFYNAGIVKTYHGRFQEAFEDFELTVSKSQTEKTPEVLAKSLYALAAGNYQCSHFEVALGHLKQLNKLLKMMDKTYLKGTMDLLYGNIYSELGEYERALQFYQQANVHLVSKSCWNLYGYILFGKGTIFKKINKYNQSLLYFQMAQEAINPRLFKRLKKLIQAEISSVNDSNIDIYLDRKNRTVREKTLGVIDFKHRFVLLDILFLLAESPGVYYEKDKLTDIIWGNRYNPLIHDKLIYTSICRLRKLIEPLGKKYKYIIREKDGYAFNPHVNIRFNQEDVEFLGNIDMSSPV